MTPDTAPSAPLFTSGRERRLWAWTLAVVVAIYTTLGLARTLAGELRGRNLLDSAFVFAALLTALTIVTLASKTRPGRHEIGVYLGVAAVYILVFVRMALPEERTHLIEYGVVAAFVYAALRERASQGRRVPVPAVIAVAVTAMLGIIDEALQGVLPSRVFDPVDMLFNVLAAMMAVGASVALGWARRRKSHR